VRNDDGSFRWLVLPGAYVVSSIGTGTYTDDQRIYWPRVVCAFRPPSAPRCTRATLRLEGARYEEEVKLSTGKLYTSRRQTPLFPGGRRSA